MPRKSKRNYTTENMPEKDRCQTPPYALTPLLPYVKRFDIMWEPAAGERLLLEGLSNNVSGIIYHSDILDKPHSVDFFHNDVLEGRGDNVAIVTNPPYSLKYPWLERCYELGYPFALLMPADTLFAKRANTLFQKYGIEIILMNPRIDFKMPDLGWSGNGAQMATAWFTWKLSIGQMITFADISEEKKAFKKVLRDGN